MNPLCLSEWGDVWPDADPPAQSFSSHHRAARYGPWRRVQRGLQGGKTKNLSVNGFTVKLQIQTDSQEILVSFTDIKPGFFFVCFFFYTKLLILSFVKVLKVLN